MSRFWFLLGPKRTDGSSQSRRSRKATVLLRGIVVDGAGEPVVGGGWKRFRLAISCRGQYHERGGRCVLAEVSQRCVLRIKCHRLRPIQENGRVHQRVRIHFGQSEHLSCYVKPILHTEVTVVDASSQPIADATVRLLVDYADLQTGSTDANGKIRLSIPMVRQ